MVVEFYVEDGPTQPDVALVDACYILFFVLDVGLHFLLHRHSYTKTRRKGYTRGCGGRLEYTIVGYQS